MIWLADLPVQQRFRLSDGTRVLAAHAGPGYDHGPGVEADTSDEQLADLVKGCDADLFLCGDTHWPCDRWAGSVHVVNPGSVSNPRRDLTNDYRPCYALLDDQAEGYTITLWRVELDVAALTKAVNNSHFYPNPEWLLARYRTET